MATVRYTLNMNHVDNLYYQKKMNQIVEKIKKQMKRDKMKLVESFSSQVIMRDPYTGEKVLDENRKVKMVDGYTTMVYSN